LGFTGESMLALNEALNLIRGLNYYETLDYTIFTLPRSAIQPYILFKNSLRFKERLQLASSVAWGFCPGFA
jgi:hypothetical protein